MRKLNLFAVLLFITAASAGWAFFVSAQTPPTPVLNSITPNQIENNNTPNSVINLTISGSNFTDNSTYSSEILVNNVPYPLGLPWTNVNSPTQITMGIAGNSPAGDYSISIRAIPQNTISVNSITISLRPPAPTGLAATAISSSEINLNWTDLAPNENNYRVERATSVNGPFAEIVGTLPANSTSFSDTNLAAGTTYYYRVRVTEGNFNSNYSSIVSATTQPPPTTPFSIENDQVRFNFELTNNQVTFLSVINKLTTPDYPFDYNVPAFKLWEVGLRQLPLPTGANAPLPIVQKVHQTDCQGATTQSVTGVGSANTLTITWNNCRSNSTDPTNSFTLKLKIEVLAGNPIANWRFEVQGQMPNWNLHYVSLFTGFADNDPALDSFLMVPATGRLVRNPQSTIAANPTPSSGYGVPNENWQHFQLYSYYHGTGSNGRGVYMASHDGKATHTKFTGIFGYNTRFELQFAYLPENPSTTQVVPFTYTHASPYPLAIGVFTGDWYDAAQIYRSWAEGQLILSKGKLISRSDVPLWFKNLPISHIGYNLYDLANPSPLSQATINNYVTKWVNVRSHYGLLGEDSFLFHWFWHTGNSLGFYQPFPGLGTFFQALKNQNIYTGGRVLSFSYDSAGIGSPCGSPTQNGATHVNGQIDSFGAGATNIHLNPYTGFSLCYMNDFVQNRLLPTHAVMFFYDNPYFDDVSYNSAHGNPLGQGGSWLYDAIAQKMEAVRLAARATEPRFITAHEASFEGYIRASDITGGAYTFIPPLVVKPTNIADELRIPLQATLYHDYTLLSTGNEMADYVSAWPNILINLEDIDFTLAWGFNEGRQLNANEPYLPNGHANHELLNPGSPVAAFPAQAQIIVNHTEFLKKLIEVKKTTYGKKYLTYGQLLRPLNLIGVPQIAKIFGNPTIPGVSPGGPNYPISAPKIQSSVWRANDGSNTVGVVLTNPENTPTTFNLSLNASTYGLSPSINYNFVQLEPTASTPIQQFTGTLNTSITMPAKSVKVYEIAQFVAPPTPPPPPFQPPPTPLPPPPPLAGLPNTPSNLTTSAIAPTQILSVWTDNASNETGFKIERSLNPTSGFIEIVSNLPANSTSFTDTDLTQNTTYYYRVRAFNSFGNSPYSNVAQATTPLALTLPNPPTNVGVVVISSNQMRINWTDTANNEIGYRIERSTNGINFTTIESILANYYFRIIGNLNPNTTYYFRMRAYNSLGNSAYSNVASARTSGIQGQIIFTINLYRGVSHPQVRILQQCLNNKGIAVASSGVGSLGNETTFFGSLTQVAVQRFQTNQNIVSAGTPGTTGYGSLGPRTRAALNAFCSGMQPSGPPFTKILTLGMRDPEITLLQQFLAKNPLIYPERTVTGYFGSLTLKALKNFQRKYGIPETGVVDQATIDKLNQLYNAIP